LGAAKSAVSVAEQAAESAVAAGEKAIEAAAETVAEVGPTEKTAQLLSEKLTEKVTPAPETQATKTAAPEPSKKERKKPVDYDDYWYEDENGDWYNEYDLYGWESEPEETPATTTTSQPTTTTTTTTTAATTSATTTTTSTVKEPEKDTKAVEDDSAELHDRSKLSLKLPPRPADYDFYWYQDDDGQWRNEYDDQVSKSFFMQSTTDEEILGLMATHLLL